MAASTTVSNVLGMTYTEAGQRANCSNESPMVRLPDQHSADGLPTFYRPYLVSVSVDHLDNTDAPLIPDAYMYLLGVQSLVSLSDGPARYTSSTTHSRSKNHPQVQPSPCVHRACGPPNSTNVTLP